MQFNNCKGFKACAVKDFVHNECKDASRKALQNAISVEHRGRWKVLLLRSVAITRRVTDHLELEAYHVWKIDVLESDCSKLFDAVLVSLNPKS